MGGEKKRNSRYKTLVRSKWKLTRETRNSYHLILKGVCCAINPFACPKGVNSPATLLTQIKHNSLFGAERSLLRHQPPRDPVRYRCELDPYSPFQDDQNHVRSLTLCNLGTYFDDPLGWSEWRRNKTVDTKLWYGKLTRNETRNSYHLILKGVCCAINPFEHVLVQRG